MDCRFVVLLLFSFLVQCTGEKMVTIGAYNNTDAWLPCLSPEQVPIPHRLNVTWSTEGEEIGTYSRESGFRPGGNPAFAGKFNMTSMEGELIVLSAIKDKDEKNYTCEILTNDTNSSGQNTTDTVELVIGNGMSNFYMVTNGSKHEECYEHIGLGALSCHVTSDPEVEFGWGIQVPDYDYCKEIIENRKDTCIEQADGQFHCSSTITPTSYCYGYYECYMRYRLGDNINHNEIQCVYIKELPVGTWWTLWMTLVVTFVAIIFAIFLALVIIAACCGTVVFAGCAGVGCTMCCVDKCNKKNSSQVDTVEHETVFMAVPPDMDAGMSSKATYDPPPAYTPV